MLQQALYPRLCILSTPLDQTVRLSSVIFSLHIILFILFLFFLFLPSSSQKGHQVLPLMEGMTGPSPTSCAKKAAWVSPLFFANLAVIVLDPGVRVNVREPSFSFQRPSALVLSFFVREPHRFSFQSPARTYLLCLLPT